MKNTTVSLLINSCELQNKPAAGDDRTLNSFELSEDTSSLHLATAVAMTTARLAMVSTGFFFGELGSDRNCSNVEVRRSADLVPDLLIHSFRPSGLKEEQFVIKQLVCPTQRNIPS